MSDGATFETTTTGPTTVLVADDNRVDQLILSSIVKRHGYEVLVASDGDEALAMYTEHEPEMVLLDVIMPGRDGLAVARELRRRVGDRFLPIIFLTSLNEASELAMCVSAGGDDFLSKPYNEVIIAAKLAAFDRMRQMHLMVSMQRDEIAQHNLHLVHEQEVAKAVFDNVAASVGSSAGYIRQLISPLAVFNGDVLLSARSPGGGTYVLLGDFTGHGLPAAIGTMPLSEAFVGMTEKGFLLQEVVRECNAKLKKILPPGYFCCATVLAIDFRKRTVEVWSGGLPDGLVLRRNRKPSRLVSSHLPLGILDTLAFDDSTTMIDLDLGDRILLCTDGLTEARSQSGDMFGMERMEAYVRERPLGECFDRIVTAAREHIETHDRDDDLTLVEVTMVEEAQVEAAHPDYRDSGQIGPEDWRLTYQMGPDSLRAFNPLPLLQQILMEVPQLRVHGSAIYSVLAELYSNALEHGVLGLDSSLKGTSQGFATYYSERTNRLEELAEGFVRFEFESSRSEKGGSLTIRVIDSGPGFDHAALGSNHDRSGRLYGRGVGLVEELCAQVRYVGRGNEVEASFHWSEPLEAAC